MGDRLKRALLEQWQEHLEETVDRSMFSAIYLRSSKSQLILQDVGAPWSCGIRPRFGVQLWGSQSAVPYSGLGNGIHPVRTVGA